MFRKLAQIADELDRAGLPYLADRADFMLKTAGEDIIYDLPMVCTVAIFRKKGDDLEVVVEARRKDPETFALVGGHAEDIDGQTEQFAHCAVRETKEETGLTLDPDKLVFVTRRLRTDKKHKIDLLFAYLYEGDEELEAGDDAADAFWCSVDELPELAWDHCEFVERALLQLFKDPVEREVDISGLHSQWRTSRGCLIVVEGTDCSGKSTQVKNLVKKLENKGYKVCKTKWASSELLEGVLKKCKKTEDVPPVLYSLLNAADMEERYFREILPALGRGEVVVCDRYVYTSLARDSVRGVDPEILVAAYKNFLKPDLVFYCQTSPKIALERQLKERDEFPYYGAGLDLHLDSDQKQAFMKYQTRVINAYDQIFKQIDTCEPIDTEGDVDKIFKKVWKKVQNVLEDRGLEPK